MMHCAGGGADADAIVAFPYLALGVAFMNAPMTRNQFAFSLGELTYIDSNYDEEATLFLIAQAAGYQMVDAVSGRLHRMATPTCCKGTSRSLLKLA